MGGQIRNRLVATTFLVVAGTIVPGIAQDVGERAVDGAQREGRWATLGFESGLEVDDNLDLNVNSPGVSTTFTNQFALEFGKSTQVDRLVFGLTGDLRYEAQPDEDNELLLLSPRASVIYNRFGINSSLRLSGDIRRRDLSRTEEFGADIDGDGIDDVFDLLTGSGFLIASNLGFRYVHGLNAPIRLAFSANVLDQSYDVDNDLLFDDSQTVDFAVEGEFRFTPVTTGLASFSLNNFTADDITDTERETTRVNVGLRHEYAGIWTFEGTVGLAEIVTSRSTARNDAVDDGSDINLLATRRLTYGSAFGELTRLLRVSGERTTLRFGGAYDLPDGSLTGSVGRTVLEGGAGEWLFGLTYLKELKDGQLSTTLNRSVRSSSDVAQTDRLVTDLSLDYLKRINTSQALRIGLDRSEVDSSVDSVVTSQFSATYSYGLTRDWDVNLGYQHRRTNISAGRTASSNSLSLTLSRDFDLF